MDILYNIYNALSIAYDCAYAYVFPTAHRTILSTVERVDTNRYKVVIHFPDRAVAIQFNRPRGPLFAKKPDTPDALLPYLQNDRITPITIHNAQPRL